MTDIAAAPAFADDDLVYVDPENKKIVGKVEFDKNGNPKKMEMPAPTEEHGRGRGGKRDKRFYPWGSYRSMKKVYQVEGKVKRVENGKTLEEILPKALEQAFWND